MKSLQILEWVSDESYLCVIDNGTIVEQVYWEIQEGSSTDP